MAAAGFDLDRIRQLAFGAERPAAADDILRTHTAEVDAQLADLAAGLDGLRRLPGNARDRTQQATPSPHTANPNLNLPNPGPGRGSRRRRGSG